MLHGSPARRFHEATKHTRQHTVGGRMLPLGEFVRPPQFKGYAGGELLPFPDRFEPLTPSALKVLAGTGPTDRGIPSRTDLEQLCHLANGVLRWRQLANHPDGGFGFRAAPCTGALYHVELYLACAELEDLAAGLYHHDARAPGLRRLRTGDPRGLVIEAAAGEPAVAEAPVVMLVTSCFWRNAWKYAARAYRHTYWDGGVVLANVLAVARALRLPATVVLGFVDSRVEQLLDLVPDREVPVALVALGSGGPRAAATPPAELHAREVEPLFSLAEHFPEIPAAHAATSLASAAEVLDWRAAAPGRSTPPAAARATPPSIEEAIVGRRSTRSFAATPLTDEQLRLLLDCTLAPVPADVAVDPGTLHLVVTAVEGMEPGLYRIDGGRPVLLSARARDGLRGTAGRMALGQDLGAEAAVNVAFLADLDDVVGRLGDRGWRVAHLGASIAAGRLEVAAEALGLGATGLTFYDDEVVELFGLDGRRTAVSYLAAVGMPWRPGRPRVGPGD